jgi:hypothetical protein
MIDAKKSVSISSVDTGLERNDLAVSGVEEILRDELIIKKKPGVTVEPTILMIPAPSVDVATLVGVIRSLRVSKDTELTVDLSDGSMLDVERDPKFTNSKNVKPNPLTLIVEMDDEGKVVVNSRPKGDVTDLAPLTSFLAEIYKEREENGAFREGTNEVEKTIYLKIHSSHKVTDLQKFADAVRLGGASPIFLRIDD